MIRGPVAADPESSCAGLPFHLSAVRSSSGSVRPFVLVHASAEAFVLVQLASMSSSINVYYTNADFHIGYSDLSLLHDAAKLARRPELVIHPEVLDCCFLYVA